MDRQKLKRQNQRRETWKRTLIGIHTMYRTDCAHPALLWVLVESRWVSLRKKQKQQISPPKKFYLAEQL